MTSSSYRLRHGHPSRFVRRWIFMVTTSMKICVKVCREEIVGVPLRKGTRIDRIMTSRNRCFLVLTVYLATQALIDYTLFTPFQQCVSLVIHVPALRGNPRTHGTTGTAFDLLFPHRYEGTFEHYVASIIESWQDKRDDHLEKLGRDLELLGLTWRIRAVRLNDVEIELRAARLPRAQGGAGDPVNIADVGVGVSQVLPALVALLTAVPGQLVYLEHPERDLHPPRPSRAGGGAGHCGEARRARRRRDAQLPAATRRADARSRRHAPPQPSSPPLVQARQRRRNTSQVTRFGRVWRLWRLASRLCRRRAWHAPGLPWCGQQAALGQVDGWHCIETSRD